MSFADEIAADLLALEAEFNQVFTWSGTDYPCVTGSVARRKSLALDGWEQSADLIVYARMENFGDVSTAPQLKEKITFNSREYRIDETTVPAGSPFIKFTCSDVNRMA